MDDDTQPADTTKPPKRPRPYQKTGLTRLRSTINKLGGRVIDRRTVLGKALDAWRRELVADLGGAEALSTQQRALVDVAVRSKLMLDSIDAWLLTQKSLVSAKRKALLPAVRERASLAASFQATLKDLGLERKARELPTLEAYLSQRNALLIAHDAPGATRTPETAQDSTPVEIAGQSERETPEVPPGVAA